MGLKEDSEPRLAMVIARSGIRLIRFVYTRDGDRPKAFKLYREIEDLLDQIDKRLKGKKLHRGRSRVALTEGLSEKEGVDEGAKKFSPVLE